jgi:thiol-disulfide isomerase/thioredoxin
MKPFLSALLLCCCLSSIAVAQGNDVIHVGMKAPELSFNNPKGDLLVLSKINKERLVLLDFWASWCRPCRGANPSLVRLYETYKDKSFKNAKKGFTVISVSLDQKEEAWKAAIEKDNLHWDYHMSDLGGWESKAAKAYGIVFIPQAFLITPDGKIAGMYNTAEEAEADLQKLLK